jgi:hypothetical protein
MHKEKESELINLLTDLDKKYYEEVDRIRSKKSFIKEQIDNKKKIAIPKSELKRGGFYYICHHSKVHYGEEVERIYISEDSKEFVEVAIGFSNLSFKKFLNVADIVIIGEAELFFEEEKEARIVAKYYRDLKNGRPRIGKEEYMNIVRRFLEDEGVEACYHDYRDCETIEDYMIFFRGKIEEKQEIENKKVESNRKTSFSFNKATYRVIIYITLLSIVYLLSK